MSLREATLRSAGWLVLRFTGRQGANTVAFFALAGILTPAEFGLGSFAVAFGMLGRIAVQRGLRDRIIQLPDLTAVQINTVFWTNAALGLFIAVLIAGAGAYARLDPARDQLAWMILAAAAIPLVASFAAIQEARLERAFKHQYITAAQSIASVLAAAGAVLLALNGSGAWAVVFLSVAETVMIMLTTAVIARWVPGLRVDVCSVPGHLAYAWPVAMSSLATMGSVRIAQLIVGAVLGPAMLAFFRIGLQVNTLLMQVVAAPIGQALLPAYARAGADRAGQLMRAQAAFAFIVTPIFLFSAALAQPAIEWVLGPQWAEAGRLAAVLCLSIFATFTVQPLSPLLIADGLTGSSLRLSLANSFLGLALLIAGAQISVFFAAIGLVLRAVAAAPYSIWIANRQFGVAPTRYLGAALVPALLAGVAALSGYALTLSTLAKAIPTPVALAVAGALSSLLYAVLVRVAAPLLATSAYASLVSLAPASLRRFL